MPTQGSRLLGKDMRITLLGSRQGINIHPCWGLVLTPVDSSSGMLEKTTRPAVVTAAACFAVASTLATARVRWAAGCNREVTGGAGCLWFVMIVIMRMSGVLEPQNWQSGQC
jgi:hypothetical protein